MRFAILLLGCAAGFSASALAQNGSDFQQTQGPSTYGSSGGGYGNSWSSDQTQTGYNAMEPQPKARDQGAPAGDAARPVDLDAARQNFAALVESYVSKRSGKGYWSYVEKKGRRARRLVEPSVDEASVRRVRGARYAARVRLRDEGGGKPVALEFEADFSGTDWKIAAVRPAVSSRR